MKNDERLTIFTPTFNRMELLERLYESLKKQKNKNFTWLIIDDGSTDGTNEFLQKVKLENCIDIKIIKQDNLGKYIAYNRAIEFADSKYFCCVDSDDYLLNESIEVIYNDLEKLEEDTIGLVYPWSKKVEYKVKKYVNIQDFKFIYGVNQENTIIFKTKFLKLNRFPENRNEKFMSEEVLYNELAKMGNFKFVNKVVIQGEYLEDGLTKNIYKLWISNYQNTMILFSSRFEYLKVYRLKYRFINRCKCIINCNIINILKKENVLKNTPNLLYTIGLLFPSLIYLILKRRKF